MSHHKLCQQNYSPQIQQPIGEGKKEEGRDRDGEGRKEGKGDGDGGEGRRRREMVVALNKRREG